MSSEFARQVGLADRASSRPERFRAIGERIAAGWALPIVVACSLALFAINTRHGIGILPDSTRYMGINDRPYDAPLYAWLLTFVALPSFIGVVKAATIVGVVLVGLNTLFCWELLIHLTRSAAAALIGTALLIFSPQFVGLHSSAMSEPLFLFFMFATLLAFRAWLIRQQTIWLSLCALLVALCSLVRFTGPPLGAAIALALLLQNQKSYRSRLSEAAMFTIVAASVFFVWMIASQAIAGHSTGRDLGFNGNAGAREWSMALRSVAAWLLPEQFPRAVRGVAALVILGAGFGLAFRNALIDLGEGQRATDGASALVIAAVGIFIPLYFAFLVLATQVEANLVINSRYAFPALAATIVLFTCAASRWLEEPDRQWSLPIIICVAFGLLSVDIVRTGVRSYSAYQHGFGFASVDWQHSPTMMILRPLPPGTPIWSNGPDAISYVLERPAHFIPHKVELRTGKPDPHNPYPAQLAQMRTELEQQGGYVVFLDRVDWRSYLGSEAELVHQVGLRKIASTKDGRIYQLAAAP